MGDRELYLGTDGSAPLLLDADHLTTHAVCLGMTGSGKTGLGIVALEELARRGIPILVIDLKGDMVNLLLQFPELAPSDFEPWLPPDTEGDRGEAAAGVAALWRKGLEGSGLGGDDIAAVRNGVRWQLVTPGLASGAPLDVLPALSAPEGWDPDADPDGARERVDGVTSALLSLVGRGGDPLSDRDQVLVSSVILEHWRRGDPLDLPGLLGSLAEPPMERLGVLPLETVYPRKERMELVLALNTLLASPAFAAWTQGVPLTMEALLGTTQAPRGTIVTVSHLDDRQRLFVLTLLASELVAWMRRQPGSSGLRALMYIDEVHGILPPYPAKPPTKAPLMTLLKQGRAFGVGVWLATQNPVDIDYKALGNAGVKLVGRLITDRDRDRALEGLGMKVLPDGTDADRLVAGLAKRQFLLYDVRAKRRTRVFSSRWAVSYLRGPVMTAELGPLLHSFTPAASGRGLRGETAPRSGGMGRTEAAGGASRPPVVEADLPTRFWAGGTGEARPALFFRSRVTVERRSLGLFRQMDELWLVPGGEEGLEWEAAQRLEAEPPLVEEPDRAMQFPAALPGPLARELARAEQRATAWRARQPVMVLANRALKLAAEPGEGREAFLERCLEAADRADDARQERVRAKFERRIESVRRRLEREREELARDQRELEARKAEEKLGVVEGLFSVLMGSRSLRSAAGKAGSRARGVASKRRMRQRAEASVQESISEIARLEDELEELAVDLDEEIGRIAAESEEKAHRIEEVQLRPKRADVTIRNLSLVWRGGET